MLRLALIVLWSSFLAAIVAEGCFFSWFDPHDLLPMGRPIELSRLAIYTLGFFIFWAWCALASLLACYLIKEQCIDSDA